MGTDEYRSARHLGDRANCSGSCSQPGATRSHTPRAPRRPIAGGSRPGSADSQASRRIAALPQDLIGDGRDVEIGADRGDAVSSSRPIRRSAPFSSCVETARCPQSLTGPRRNWLSLLPTIFYAGRHQAVSRASCKYPPLNDSAGWERAKGRGYTLNPPPRFPLGHYISRQLAPES